MRRTSCFRLVSSVSTARANYRVIIAVGERFHTDSVELEAFYYQIETAAYGQIKSVLLIFLLVLLVLQDAELLAERLDVVDDLERVKHTFE